MNEVMLLLLFVALLFFILELGNPGLFLFLSFSLGAIVSAMVSIYNESLIVQSLTFLGGTIVALFALRHWLVRTAQPTEKNEHTNVYALQGKRGLVVRTIEVDSPGQIKVQGEVWSARSLHGERIEHGEQIEVVQVKGSHLIVQKVS